MNRFNIILFLIFLAISLSLRGQSETRILDDQVPVKVYRLSQAGDSVYLTMDLNLKNLKLSTDRSLELTPVITGAKGEEHALKSLMINGKQRHKAFLRDVYYNGWEDQIGLVHEAVFPLKEVKNKTVRYKTAFPYENWMQHANMSLMSDLCGCAGYEPEHNVYKIANRIVMANAKPYRALPNVAYIRPALEQVKERSQSNNVYLDFPVSRTEINPYYGNNANELRKIESIIREIQGDQNVKVSGVMITGFASPEGRIDFNNQLSQGRAEALRGYLAMRVGIPPQLYRVGYGGEDWNGLARVVQDSHIQPAGTILSIIRNNTPERRKMLLKELNGGQIYRFLLDNIYPRLRRVVARIDYSVKNFNLEEAKQVIKTHPEQLSLNEMFMVANSYPEGSKEYIDVFMQALRAYPNDPVANLNAAAAALLENDQTQAEHYLRKAPHDRPEYYNDLGLLYMMKGNNERAKSLFRQAADGNLQVALKNLDELKKKEEAELRMKN